MDKRGVQLTGGYTHASANQNLIQTEEHEGGVSAHMGLRFRYRSRFEERINVQT